MCKSNKNVSLRITLCGLGSNPRSDSICRLSLFLVPTLAPRAIPLFSLLFRKKNIPSGQEKCNVHCTCLNWRYLLSKRGKQMGVHDSAVWKDVDALTRLKIRWRSTNKTKITVNNKLRSHLAVKNLSHVHMLSRQTNKVSTYTDKPDKSQKSRFEFLDFHRAFFIKKTDNFKERSL